MTEKWWSLRHWPFNKIWPNKLDFLLGKSTIWLRDHSRLLCQVKEGDVFEGLKSLLKWFFSSKAIKSPHSRSWRLLLWIVVGSSIQISRNTARITARHGKHSQVFSQETHSSRRWGNQLSLPYNCKIFDDPGDSNYWTDWVLRGLKWKIPIS